jgi:glycosyltransferase involved in cell wall biosynthesis
MNRLFPSFLGSGSVAVSSELHDSLRDDLHVPAERIRTIPYGTDASHFRPPTQKERHEARTELGVQPDEFVISVIGRLNPVKRQDLIVEATSQLRDRGVAATALIAGSGDWETALHGKIDEFGAHRYVKMLGFTDARKVLWASDALALPSSWESFGIVISEAMLCGVVPVRTPAAGARDQIQDGTDGFIVPFDNASAFAERFAYLAEQPEVRHRMSDAAQRSVRKRFTADIMTRDMLSLYEQTIDLGSASEHSAPSPPQPA